MNRTYDTINGVSVELTATVPLTLVVKMSILLAYNESDSWEVGKLAKATEIKEDLLVQVNRKCGVNVLVFLSFNC